MDPVAMAQAAVTAQSALTQVNIGISAMKMGMDMQKQVVALLSEMTVPVDSAVGQVVNLVA